MQREYDDSPERSRPSLHHHPPRRDAYRLGSPSPRPVGGIVRGACPRSLRSGKSFGYAATSCDRTNPRLGAWRDHDVPVTHGGRTRHAGGQRPERGGTKCRVCGWSGGGSRTRRCARARRGRLCNQGRASCRSTWSSRKRRAIRMPVATPTASGGDSCACPRRPAITESYLLVRVRVLTAHREIPSSQQPAGRTRVRSPRQRGGR